MRELTQITKALADENRVRVLLALRKGELCACQVTALFGLAPSTVSKHLALLHGAGLVESRKEGRWIYFRLPEAGTNVEADRALRWIIGAAEGLPRVKQDAVRLKEILKEDPSELCRRQCE
jgi:ArsR family transcriptional regulator, arsenate/arsenite/antimonite-responsive transcriptional repressor